MTRPYLRVKFERHSRGWTQKDVALRAGIPQPTVSAIESGRINPTEDELYRLAQAFLITPAEVLMKPVAIKDVEEHEAVAV